MDKETAKELIRKGILHGDKDLVDLGNSMLAQFFPEDETPNSSYMESQPPKKKRGRPKKKIEIKVKPIITDSLEDDFIAPPRRDTNTDQDGKRFTKRQPINVQTKPITTDEFHSDTKIDKLLQKDVKIQYREKVKKKELICNNCEKPFSVAPNLYQTTCDKCILRKGNRVS